MFLLACTLPSIEALPSEDSVAERDELPHDSDVRDLVPEASPAPPPFGLSRVHRIEVGLSAEARASLQSIPDQHVQASLRFDDQELASPVALRIKGRYGSRRTLDEKPSFKIDLNRFGDQDLFDLEHLNLNNMVQDSAQLHDFMAYEVYRAMGVPCPWVGYGWVVVDGEDYGLYALVEDYDKRWLDDRFEAADGNLYDGDYFLAPDWSWYQLLDFDTVSQDYFQLDEGSDVQRADIKAITAALDGLSDPQSFDETLDAYIVMDEYLRLWAVETWLGQYDGYNFNKNNYRLYFDPSDGRAWMMGWDHDWSFYPSTPLTTPVGRLALACRADSSCHAAYLDAIDSVCDEIPNMGLVETLDQVRELIKPYVEQDPRKEADAWSIRTQQDEVERWIGRRCDQLANVDL